MLIGLTGQIGAGKSTVAEILESRGAVVIDADCIGREVVDRSVQLRKRLAQHFGKNILTPGGNLRRKKLAEIAFATPDGKLALDKLVHPYLLRELRAQVKKALRRNRLVVIDAALLLNWDLDREVDETWVVTATQTNRFDRLAARGISLRDARARQTVQLPLAIYRARATRLIANNGTLSDLRQKVLQLLRRISPQTD